MLRTTIVAIVWVMCGVGIAGAQPGADGPPPAPGPYAPPPAPGPYAPPPQPGYPPPPYTYQPRPQVVLTADENDLLQQGEISDGQHLGGGLAAVFLGFGAGQIVQGRWQDTGWIFTVGESASFVAFVWGASEQLADCLPVNGPNNCDSNRGVGLLVGGLLAFSGFRVGEVVDAFIAPPRHNARLHDLRQRLGMPASPQYGMLAPYVAPAHGGGTVGGLTLRF